MSNKPQKQDNPLQKPNPKHAVFISLLNQGFTQVEAYKLAGYKGKHPPQNASNLKRTITTNYINEEKMLKFGQKAAKKIFNDYLKDEKDDDGNRLSKPGDVTPLISMQNTKKIDVRSLNVNIQVDSEKQEEMKQKLEKYGLL